MSEKNKLYYYEVDPPKGVWEKIVVELDDSAIDHKFPAALKNMEVLPGANTWQNISIALDESLMVDDYAAKLAGLEISPPANAWQKITADLDADKEIIAPVHRKFSPILRYAVAASIVGFITWGSIQLFSNKSDNTSIVKQDQIESLVKPESDPSNQSELISNGSIAIDDITAALEEARNDAALEASKKTYAKLDITTAKSKIKNAAGFYFTPDSNEPGIRGLDNWQPKISKQDLTDRYFTLMTPDGNIIRISKKLSDIVGCVAGAEQDQECLEQLKEWQQKMANPKSPYSSGNFIEILNLVNSLQDN